mmetsp:Transcript_2670/g.4561  ORF Transcript_2670/g.4561 Transcript_2670/m.4561 type:complete len:95 (-) Transcript_2670:803-1087(-)|eukprot:CAMPEP_0119101074 /NCGR_PEP_ID=MMETSP1180-20130426/205_1 /TAXON_ID=3052 ORGANISM="Chlamydomonas cf sp, Strain CCMP681" /NCGR_SAMPLE_ID=MMETSP1180 /ASSEMBLY_ACC=CAM_ASM_000741 /LENGTH=94 /DNA_ID=CAMNT_0007085117 /DNA_START=91 /DNA_END=375 /DNA_ORIENTATION=+
MNHAGGGVGSTGGGTLHVPPQATQGQDLVLIVILLAVMAFFLLRNMKQMKGLKLKRTDGAATETEFEGATTDAPDDEEPSDEDSEQEGDKTKDD